MWWKWPLVFLLSPSCHQQEGWILFLHDPQRSLLRAVSPSPSSPHLMAPIRDWELPYQGNSHFPRALSVHGFSNSLPLSSPCSISTPFLPSYKNTHSRLTLIQDQGQQSQHQGRPKAQQAPVQCSSRSPFPRLLANFTSPSSICGLLLILVCVFGVPGFMSSVPHLSTFVSLWVGLSGDKCVRACFSVSSFFVDVCVSVFLSLSLPRPTSLLFFSNTLERVCVCECVSMCCVLVSRYLTLPQCFSCSVSVCLSSGLSLGVSLQQHPLGLHFGGSRRRLPTHPSQSSLPCQMELISYGRKKLHSDWGGGYAGGAEGEGEVSLAAA